MNQLLISKRMYLTPEVRRERLMYKIYFALSIFAVCILISYYAYGAYQGYQDELLAKDILETMSFNEEIDDTTISQDDAIVVFLEADHESNIKTSPSNTTPVNEKDSKQTLPSKYVAKNGKTYNMVGKIEIPRIKLNYPILAKTTDETLKISVAKFWGPEPNEVGNLCIAGHNTTYTGAFGKLKNLKNGDIIKITDLTGKTLEYKVYSHYIVKASNVEPTSQLTNGRKEITLITCTNGVKDRRIIKAAEVLDI